MLEFKDFDCGEKIDDQTRSAWSKICSTLANDMEIGKLDCKCTVSDNTLEGHKEFYSKK